MLYFHNISILSETNMKSLNHTIWILKSAQSKKVHYWQNKDWIKKVLLNLNFRKSSISVKRTLEKPD